MAQLPLDLGHRPALGRADFLVAPSNADAVAWLDRWPDWPGPALVLHGPPGSGKTHLAHSFAAHSGARLIEPAALALEPPPALLGDAPAAIVDTAEAAPEEALLHLHNWLGEQRRQLLVIARAAPNYWPIRLADLRSRLIAAPAVAVAPPDDALLAAVLVKLFADRQLLVGEEVIAYLLSHIERSVTAAERTVAKLDRAGLAARRRVTVPLAREMLAGEADDGEP